MRIRATAVLILCSFAAMAQVDLIKPFKDCGINGSITVFDFKNKRWIYSDTADAKRETLPASTFKVINLLIALETGVIKDENDMVKWIGKTDTTLYGYRPDIYKDMTVKEAFEVSAGWVFVELAKKIGKKRYQQYLKRCGYGNINLSEPGTDFWNFGPFAISPINQVALLVKVYNSQLPFSKRNLSVLKRVMVTEKTSKYIIRSKTGWTRWQGEDIGWWVGYVERNENVYFFATRLIKKRTDSNPRFGECRKTITKTVLKQLGAIE